MNAGSVHDTRGTAHVTLVDSIGCHFCADADAALAELAQEFTLHIEHVAVASDVGRDLMADHGAGMSPLVLLDGKFVSSGRLSRGRLRKMLVNGGYASRQVAS